MNQQIQGLVARYEGLSPAQHDRLSEESTKTSFITPLFQALGWETENPNEVTLEESVSGGRVDYAFRLNGVTRFYVEAKRLSADIYEIDHARQAINYAFNKGVPWAILTNFQRLVVFDAFAQAPRQAPPPRVLDLTCRDFLEPESGLALLTKAAVAEDRLREQAERTGVRRRSVELQMELYQAMRGWRETLINQIATAQAYALEDIHLADEAVQRLLDRLIFLRNCEDRSISEGHLRAILNQWRANPSRVHLAERLARLFADAAATYDSELFTTDALIDRLLPRLGTQVDSVLGDVLQGLYYPPRSWAEYNFKDIDSDVLGAVYEQYLGHVAQRASALAAGQERQLALGIPVSGYEVEAKRRRRKEQGIYYTPKWVVDYIVEQTLGRWLEEHGDDSEALERLAVLDPACGSGSFLIHAYETLLEHHGRLRGGPVDHLDRQEREHILRRNIYGVDLDPQAVEIARLSLLLRMVREEEKLPELKGNVLQGNSLISGGATELQDYFGDAWEEKHPLTWETTFREVMQRGGFDVVIGNPPYVETSLIPAEDRNYYRASFESAHDQFDLYVLFIEKGLKLLKPNGRLGFITSGKFLKAEYGQKVNALLHHEATIEAVINLSAQKDVFGKAINYPVIIVFRRGASSKSFLFVDVPGTPSIETMGMLESVCSQYGYQVGQFVIEEGRWPPPKGDALALTKKLTSQPVALEHIAELYHGLQTNADPVFILEHRGETEAGQARVFSRAVRQELVLEQDLLHPLLKGSVHMRRYHTDPTSLRLLFPYYPSSGKLLPQEVLKEQYSQVWAYLNMPVVKNILESRESGHFRAHPLWYGFSYRKNHDKFGIGRPRLMTPSLAPIASFSYDPTGAWYFVGSGGGGGGGYGIELTEGTPCSLLYLLGLLNSKLLDYYLRQISSPFRGGYWAYNRQYIARLPIRMPNPDDMTEKEMHDRLVAHVTRMLELHRRLAEKGAAHDAERETIAREIRETDRAIDELVYDLYGLTAAERRLVEEEIGERQRD
ncbi:MAG: N-6 DNA methylase [Chloroflexi bacterium]|nr:N-6 DNA methylase [Chloroflexota bacterium]